MYREGKKCVLYLRVSTEMQVDGFSLDGQRNRLERFANLEEMPIVDVYQDAGKSGKSIDGRPEFKRLLSDIKGGLEIDYILVYKLSRFGRNASDILNSLELIQSLLKLKLLIKKSRFSLLFNLFRIFVGNFTFYCFNKLKYFI